MIHSENIMQKLFDELESSKSKIDFESREEIEKEYKWKLSDIYESPEKWEEAFNWLEEKSKEYSKFFGRLAESADTLAECIKLDEEIGIELGKVFLYAMLSKDVDLANTQNSSRYEKTMGLYSNLNAFSSFIHPEILAMPEDKLWKFVEEKDNLKRYKHFFDNLLRKKEHTLSAREEEILALASPVTSVPYTTFSIFDNSDIQFPKVKNEKGEEVQISHGRYTAALYSLDRDYRKRVYKNYYKPFMQYKNTIVSLFNGNIKAAIFTSKARRYKSTLEASLKPNNIPIKVYDNLINTVDENLEPLNRWAKIKKKIMKLDEFHPYDSYVTLFPKFEKEFTYEESKDIIMEALKPLGDDYINNINKAINERWIDVYETKGKRSGAYSSGTTFGVHPYVLLNWHNKLNDLFTFAHEMGHNMHSHYTGTSQPYPYANYSIFIAEVTSTMNEALLLDYLIEQSNSDEEKLALIEQHINNVVTTFYRQARFADFEKVVHQLTERGEILTPEKLCEMYGQNYKKAWGDAMVVDEEETYTWARIPHFYYDFYVYQYATSFAASQLLAEKVKTEGKPAIEKYLSFLKAGSSKYPLEVLADAGADMTSPEPIKAVINKMNEQLDIIEKLVN